MAETTLLVVSAASAEFAAISCCARRRCGCALWCLLGDWFRPCERRTGPKGSGWVSPRDHAGRAAAPGFAVTRTARIAAAAIVRMAARLPQPLRDAKRRERTQCERRLLWRSIARPRKGRVKDARSPRQCWRWRREDKCPQRHRQRYHQGERSGAVAEQIRHGRPAVRAPLCRLVPRGSASRTPFAWNAPPERSLQLRVDPSPARRYAAAAAGPRHFVAWPRD